VAMSHMIQLGRPQDADPLSMCNMIRQTK